MDQDRNGLHREGRDLSISLELECFPLIEKKNPSLLLKDLITMLGLIPFQIFFFFNVLRMTPYQSVVHNTVRLNYAGCSSAPGLREDLVINHEMGRREKDR